MSGYWKEASTGADGYIHEDYYGDVIPDSAHLPAVARWLAEHGELARRDLDLVVTLAETASFQVVSDAGLQRLRALVTALTKETS